MTAVTGISLCMIVKNEERCLARCLESVKDIVTEIIIVDTGSTDRTVEIASQYTSKIYSFEWINDFSAARNYAKQYATGDYILHLDADEYLSDGKENLKGPLDKDIYFLRIRNEVGFGQAETHQFVRLFRNHPSLYYEGALHEQINLDKNADMTSAPLNCLIFHDGYMEEVVKDKKKSNRNMEIVKKAVKENPSSFNYYNLGAQLSHDNKPEEAIEAFQKAYALNSNQTFTPRLLTQLVGSLLEVKRYEEALNVAKDSTLIYSDNSDIQYQLGVVYEKLGYIEDAKQCFYNCLDIGEEAGALQYSHNDGTASYLAHAKISMLHLEQGDYDTAYQHFLLAVEQAPNLTHLISIYVDMHPNLNSKDFMAGMIKLWPFTEPKRIEQMISYLYSLRHPAANDLIQCYHVEITQELKAWIAMVEGNYTDSRTIWSQIEDLHPVFSRDLLVLSFITQDSDLFRASRSVFNMRDKEIKWWEHLILHHQDNLETLSSESEAHWNQLCEDLMRLKKYDCIEVLINSTHNPKLRYYIAKHLHKKGFAELALDVILESDRKEDNVLIHSLARDILKALNQHNDAIYYANAVYTSTKKFSDANELLMLLKDNDMLQEAKVVAEQMKKMSPSSPWIHSLSI